MKTTNHEASVNELDLAITSNETHGKYYDVEYEDDWDDYDMDYCSSMEDYWDGLLG